MSPSRRVVADNTRPSAPGDSFEQGGGKVSVAIHGGKLVVGRNHGAACKPELPVAQDKTKWDLLLKITPEGAVDKSACVPVLRFPEGVAQYNELLPVPPVPQPTTQGGGTGPSTANASSSRSTKISTASTTAAPLGPLVQSTTSAQPSDKSGAPTPSAIVPTLAGFIVG